MKKYYFLTFACFLLLFSHAQSQDLLIKYDFQSGKTMYFKIKSDGIEIAINKPNIKKNNKFILQIQNINPFIYNITYQVSQKEVKLNIDSTKNLISTLSTNMMTIDTLIATLSSQRSSTEDLTIGLNRAFSEITSTDNQFSQFTTCYYIVGEIMASSKLTQEQIVQKMDSTARNSFGIAVGSSYHSRQIVEQKMNEFKEQFLNFKEFYLGLKPFIDTTQVKKLLAAQINAKNNIVDSLYNLYLHTSYLSRGAAISNLINVVANADFNSQVEDIAELDNVDITATMVRKQLVIFGDSIIDLLSGKSVIKKFRVNIRGEMIIHSGIGLSFTSLLNNALRYEVSDNKVTEEKDDNWVPNLTTNLSFYPFRGKFSNVGGIIGFGYPITGSTNKNLNILFGPSWTLGDKNKVIISGGMIVGQTNRLDSNWKVGDTVQDPNVVIPVTKTWKGGIFVGISLSILNTK